MFAQRVCLRPALLLVFDLAHAMGHHVVPACYLTLHMPWSLPLPASGRTLCHACNPSSGSCGLTATTSVARCATSSWTSSGWVLHELDYRLDCHSDIAPHSKGIVFVCYKLASDVTQLLNVSTALLWSTVPLPFLSCRHLHVSCFVIATAGHEASGQAVPGQWSRLLHATLCHLGLHGR